MFIPIAVLPSFKQILQSFYSRKSHAMKWLQQGQKSIFFPRASVALAEGIKALQKNQMSKFTVFIPDYFCNTALKPLRDCNIHIVFYPLTEKLTPEWIQLYSLAKQYNPPFVFILVHYFGFENDISGTIEFCKQTGAIFIEDAAHVLTPYNDISRYSVFTVFSPYKCLSVNMLGIMVMNEDMNVTSTAIIHDSEFFIWAGKRIVQSILSKTNVSLRRRKITPFDLDIEPNAKHKNTVSPMTLRLLKVVEQNIQQIKAIRRANYMMLSESISAGSGKTTILFPTLDDKVCPYLFVFRVDEQLVQDIYYKLNRSGIPAQTWPDLPPEVKNTHSISVKLRKTILTIPINQSLTTDQMRFIAIHLRRT